jgi:hypothetical protein
VDGPRSLGCFAALSAHPRPDFVWTGGEEINEVDEGEGRLDDLGKHRHDSLLLLGLFCLFCVVQEVACPHFKKEFGGFGVKGL